ncbi:MAG: adenosine deaminase [Chloroflexi bacterium]|nr:adenosine deaminase [Chloroflexota bacterium]
MDRIENFITRMPKVELHVHMEGSVRLETLLKLAKRYKVALPADTPEGLRKWYEFKDFNRFIEIYITVASCLRDGEDIELIAREFLAGQAAQNIRYSEVTYTAYTQYAFNHLEFSEQWEAIKRARAWGEQELGVRMGIIMDIPRLIPPEEGERIAEWAIQVHGDGLVALGLGGPEEGNPAGKYQKAFDRVRQAGVPCVLHAGETDGPQSIWEALQVAGSKRIGHGVRAIEDPALVAYLREKQIPLEVCPTSNVCLKVYPSYEQHSLPRLLEAGLYVTLSSDDPPMFDTTLTNEYLVGYHTWGWNLETIQKLVLNGVDATLLPEAEKQQMHAGFVSEFKHLLE